MYNEILSLLEKNDLKNDLSFPIWIYQTENIIVKNKRYFKIYLFNRYYDGAALNRITFLHNGKEYSCDSFSVVSNYNDSNVVGCAFELELEDMNSDLAIKEEIINGIIYSSSDHLTEIHTGSIDNDDLLFLKKKGIVENVYPQIKKEYWICSCGRINNKDEACRCGKSVAEAERVMNYDFDEGRINEFISTRPLGYNLEKSFAENIDSYFLEFSRVFPNIDQNKIKARFDLSEEEEKYQQLLQKKEEDDKKELASRKKRNTIMIVAGIAMAIFAAIYVFVIAPANKYKEANDLYNKKNFDEALVLFEELGTYKDSEEMFVETRYQQAMNYYATQDYENAILILDEIADRKPLALNKGKEIKYEYAMLLENTGEYDRAIELFTSLSGYRDSENQIKMCRGPMIGDEFRFGGYKWTVIGKEVDGILLLASKNLFRGPRYMSWGQKVYDKFSNEESKLILEDKAADDADTYNGIFLLSSKEFAKYKNNIPVVDRSWWLRDKIGWEYNGYIVYYVVCGNDNPMGRGDGTHAFAVDGVLGELNDGGVADVIDEVYFRPALWVSY